MNRLLYDPTPKKVPCQLRPLGTAIRQMGGRALLVGGWVRDCMLGLPLGSDCDIEVFNLSFDDLKKTLGRFGKPHEVGKHFGVFKLKLGNLNLDVSLPRTEQQIGTSHTSFQIAFHPNLTYAEAASRRDFTINSMGYDFLSDQLLDPHDGRTDLQHSRLKHVSAAFGEDPLRVLRAMQFAARFSLWIDKSTLAVCRAQNLNVLPRERLWEEFKKLLMADMPAQGLQHAEALGILRFFPALAILHQGYHGKLNPFDGKNEPHLADNPTKNTAPHPWLQTLYALNRLATLCADSPFSDANARLPLMLTALTHCMDSGTESIELKSAEAESSQVQTTAKTETSWLAFFSQLSSEKRLLSHVSILRGTWQMPALLHDIYVTKNIDHDSVAKKFDLGVTLQGALSRLALKQPLPPLLLVSEACHNQGQDWAIIATWFTAQAKHWHVWDAPPKPILQGKQLHALGFSSGPELGNWLKKAFEAQMDGMFASLPDATTWLKMQMNTEHTDFQNHP